MLRRDQLLEESWETFLCGGKYGKERVEVGRAPAGKEASD